jgi:hypothetical protein
MKMKQKILAPALFFIGLGISTLMWMGSSQENATTEDYTTSPDIPEKLTFAGEEYEFNRYDLRERLDRELSALTYLHSSTMLSLKRANRIFPVIVPILKANGIPEDFKYLMTIESSLNERALSSAKAAGLWQFMEKTGRQYGLEINSEVDERYHIEKATAAACRYLKDAYAKYGDWASVAMSYNAGMGRISSELSAQQVSSALDLLLVEETSRYFFRLIATKEVFENPMRYGFHLKSNQLYKPIHWKEITVETSIPSWTDFAKENGITYAQLKDFNIWLRDTSLANKSNSSYKIRIPLKEDLYYKPDQKVDVFDTRWVKR